MGHRYYYFLEDLERPQKTAASTQVTFPYQVPKVIRDTLPTPGKCIKGDISRIYS
jgi:hypothetical protein